MAKKKDMTQDLIKSLQGDLKPVKPIAHPLRRIAPWLVFCALYLVAIGGFIGLRPDMDTKMHDDLFIFEMILVFATGVFAALSAVYMCVPDMRGAKWIKHVALTLIAVFFLWTITRWGGEGFAIPDGTWKHCISEGVFISLIPVAALLYMLKGGATTRPIMMAAMCITGVAALAYIALRTTCMCEEIGSLFFFHVMPFLVIGTALGAVARKIFRW